MALKTDYRLVLYFCALVTCVFVVCLAGYFWSGGDRSDEAVIWIVIGVFSFFLLLATFGVITYQTLPLLSDAARWDSRFWRSMPATSQGVLGVLYHDHSFGPLMPYGLFGIRRLIVTLKHTDAKRDRVLFRATENPNQEQVDDTIRAFSTWIKMAKWYGVPAVYRTSDGLRILSDQHIREIESDPVGFVATFQRHIQKGEPIPEQQA